MLRYLKTLFKKMVGLSIARLDRETVARTYLKGNGIEIGALNNPLLVSRTAHVTYVDRMPVTGLKAHYPSIDSREMRVDTVDDGETLATFDDAAVDFVIANHFVEHAENPILAIRNMLRVLKPGGFIYLAIPDKRYTFDADRPVTTMEHLMRDFKEGPEWSRRQHYEEWLRDERYAYQLHDLMETHFSIHYHVWTQKEMVDLFLLLQVMFPFEMELMMKNRDEVIFIIRKTDRTIGE